MTILYEEFSHNISAFTPAIISAIITLCMSIYLIKEFWNENPDVLKNPNLKISLIVLIPIFTIFTIFSMSLGNKVTIQETRYYVTIDDSVPFNEIIEKYEIIEQKGEIYILKDKEVSE